MSDAPSIRCPSCLIVSHNPNDVEQRYCGNCHQFHDQMKLCIWCDEPVSDKNRHPDFKQQPFHFACGYRSIAGSVAHLEGRCSCCIVGSEEGDPPGMTKREAAMAAFETALRIRSEERTE